MEGSLLQISRADYIHNFKDKIIFRLFEVFPGALTLATLLLVILFSRLMPSWVAVFVIVFATFWLLRSIYFAIYLRAGYKKMRENERIDWLARLENLPGSKDWKSIYHLIIVPTFKESIEIIKESLSSLLNTDYPKDKMIVVLAQEAAAGGQTDNIAQSIKNEFGNKFFKFLITKHPSNLPGEIQGKGSNEAFAAKIAKELIDELSMPYEKIIVSSFDADTAVFPKYFSCLTCNYLTAENPTRTSFQPIPLFINNIWQAPLFSRIFAFATTFWQTMNQERPESLITFSSHSMSFKALVEAGFRQPGVVSDDSRIFWQCFFRYDGDYEVMPLFYPVSMDANVSQNFFRTMANIYRQQRRWAYGAGDIAYFLFLSAKNKKISLKKKFKKGIELIEGHWSWATAPLLIFFLGWLPILLGGEAFTQTLFSYNLPRITSLILTFSMVGLVVSAHLSMVLLPARPLKYGRFRYVIFALEWLMLPVVMIFFSAIPAIDAQMRLMLGKYLGFWPTEKFRQNPTNY